MTNWIKCSERLPEEGMMCLVYWKSYSNTPIIETAQFRANLWLLGEPNDVTSVKDNLISHWQPLPEPPEGE